MTASSAAPTIGANTQTQRKGPRLWSLLLFVGIGLILSFTAGTQYTAWQYDYDIALGAPVIGSLYWPWAFIGWSFDWYHSDPMLYQRAYVITASSMILVFGLYVMVFFLTQRRAKAIDSLHGTARWANKGDIHAAGLLPPKGKKSDGVFVGGWVEKKMLHYLRHNGPEHVCAFAPTRSGKGVALVIPTMLSWPHSVVAFDQKGELWALTAGWRQRHAGNRVIRFDPTDVTGTGARINPLSEIRIGEPQEVGDAQNLAMIIADPDGQGLNDHWMKTGHAFLTGIILHCLYKARDDDRVATLTDLSVFLSDPSRTMDDGLQEMLHYRHTPQGTHATIAQSARDMLNREDRERSSVHSTTVSFLTLYRDPVITQNTAVSDFAIADLMNHADPLSLYLVVRPSDKDRLRPLIRIILTQIVRRLTEKMDFDDGRSVPHYQHRLLLMLDEFASLGKLPIIEEALAYLAGYGIKAFLIVQDLAQLHKVYTRDESIISACHVRTAFAPNKIETAELLSRMTGKTTVVKRSISTSGDRFSAVLDRVSESLQEVERPLLTADECMRLQAPLKNHDGTEIIEPGDMLVMPSGFHAILGRQPLYFRDPVFAERARIAAPALSDRVTDHEGQPMARGVRRDSRSEIDALFDS